MKTLVIAATAALLASPVLAAQFDGSTSVAEFAAQHFAQDHETGDGPRSINIGGNGALTLSTSNTASDAEVFALTHFAQDHETGDGPRFVGIDGDIGGTVVSTSNQDLAALAAAKLANGPEDER